jgi:hypothetical protein
MVVLRAHLCKSVPICGWSVFVSIRVHSQFVFAALREVLFSFNAFLEATTPLSRFHRNAWIQMRRANLRAHKHG